MNQGYLTEGVTVSGVRASIGRRNIVTDVEQREAGRWMREGYREGRKTIESGGKA
ncbi:MAG TPA: hypothetical protein VI727_03790 [Candidatus Brocadiaceae bacterium]|nr:hypothetical protein [Candidatus Brocadiaceae bacterium]